MATLDAVQTEYAQRGKTVEITGLNSPSADLHSKLTGELASRPLTGLLSHGSRVRGSSGQPPPAPWGRCPQPRASVVRAARPGPAQRGDRREGRARRTTVRATAARPPRPAGTAGTACWSDDRSFDTPTPRHARQNGRLRGRRAGPATGCLASGRLPRARDPGGARRARAAAGRWPTDGPRPRAARPGTGGAAATGGRGAWAATGPPPRRGGRARRKRAGGRRCRPGRRPGPGVRGRRDQRTGRSRGETVEPASPAGHPSVQPPTGPAPGRVAGPGSRHRRARTRPATA